MHKHSMDFISLLDCSEEGVYELPPLQLHHRGAGQNVFATLSHVIFYHFM